MAQEASLTFSTHIEPSILRGVRLSRTLQGFGALWHSSPLDVDIRRRAGLWSISSEHSELDYFLSQSWQTSGWEKYFALLIQFSWVPAVIVYILSTIAFGAADAMGFLTAYSVGEKRISGVQVQVYVSPWCAYPLLLSMTTLFLYPEIALRRWDPVVFFDKVCIDQVDETRKKKGIYSLAGFLANSKHMVVLWAPSYFRRCWCVFELAVFVAIKGEGEIRWCPVFAATVRVFTVIAFTSGFLIETVLLTVGASRVNRLTVAGAFGFVVTYPWVCAVRGYMRDRHQMLDQLANFDIADAECREDADRALIRRCVTHLFHDVARFNDFVQVSLKKELMASWADFGLSYTSCCVLCSPNFAFWVQWSIGYIRAEMAISEVLSAVAAHTLLSLFAIPLFCLIAFRLCERFRAYRGGKASDKGLSLLLTLALSIIGGSLQLVGTVFVENAPLGGVWLLLLSVLVAPLAYYATLHTRSPQQEIAAVATKEVDPDSSQPVRSSPAQSSSTFSTHSEDSQQKLPGIRLYSM